jgi:adenylosuccinate lyase
MLSALSPLDGRYAPKVEALRPYFSELALIRARVDVELRYFIALSREKKFRALPAVSKAQEKALLRLVERFSEKDAAKIQSIERRTNHDVKAVEYWIKERLAGMPGLKKHLEFIHFGLTSEDVNNLAYGRLIHGALNDVLSPSFCGFLETVRDMAKEWSGVTLLSLTHGQPATPTTVGKELQVFVERLERQCGQLADFTMQGKLGGAVGNFAAHRAAVPEVNWPAFGRSFVASLGLDPIATTTQINPHDDLAELSHTMVRINTILTDMSRDLWLYISRGVFRQRVVRGEVGSSAMPHKVNPIDFENAEGNLGVSSALFTHFAEKLPISRLQRDLSDSTVQRNLGVAFGHHLLAVASFQRGLRKLTLDRAAISAELQAHPEVLAEAIQTILRRNGVVGAYEKLKALTRGEAITLAQLETFMKDQGFSTKEIKRVKDILA